jgi:hypothetical protein
LIDAKDENQDQPLEEEMVLSLGQT